MTNIQHYIIAAQPNVLRPLLDILASDQEVAIISVVNGPSNDLERLVVAIDSTRAAALADAFADRVVIEPDNPVSPL